MECSSLNTTFHFLCPRDKNHKFEAKDRLIRHLKNCKLLKADQEFFSCKYETYHLFATLKDKDEHEKFCPVKTRVKQTGETASYSTSLFKVKNPGFDPSFVPKKVSTGYYNENKERLEREEQIIKTNKSKIRVNVADTRKDLIIDDDSVNLFGRSEEGFFRMLIQQIDNNLMTNINADFGSTRIASLISIPLNQNTDLRSSPINQILTSNLVGYVAFPLSSISSGSQACLLRDSLCRGERLFRLKDQKENEYFLIGEDVRHLVLSYFGEGNGEGHTKIKPEQFNSVKGEGDNIFSLLKLSELKAEKSADGSLIEVGDKRHSGEMVGKGKIALIYLVKSEIYKKVAEKNLEERKIRETIDFHELEARKADEKRKTAKDEFDRLLYKCQMLERTNEGLKAEVSNLGLKVLQESDSSSQVNVIRTTQEISNLKSQIVEQQNSFSEELKVIKDQKMADYMKILIEDLTKLNDKIIHYKNNILAYQENIAKVDVFNQDTQQLIENYKITTEDYKRQIEGCKDLLSKEKEVNLNSNKDQKKGVILKKELSCHLCKSSYVSMVTKPCNHCLLCWSCFHAFVQNNLRCCLICDERVDFCFKIKYI